MPSLREVTAFRRGVDLDEGRSLSASDRERLLKPYLPTPRHDKSISPSVNLSEPLGAKRNVKSNSRQSRLKARSRLSSFISSLVHRVLYFAIQLVFSVYVHLRQTYHAIHDRIISVLYYHHRTPELIQRDVKSLSRLPKHLSIIVELKESGRNSGTESLQRLIEEVSEVSAWCACAGIPMLSVYERTGILKSNMPALHHAISNTFRSYFPPDAKPPLHIRAPHHAAYSPLPTPPSDTNGTSETEPNLSSPQSAAATFKPLHLLLLSASDGRDTLVDLTKTLAEMAQHGKLDPRDISAELIDAEIAESVSAEPDLLVVMAPSVYRTTPGKPIMGRRQSRSRRGSSGSRSRGRSSGITASSDVSNRVNGIASDDKYGDAVWLGAGGDLCLRGYPPWQVRLTEIFHVTDNEGAGYQVFLRALHRYADAEMRFGR